MQKGWIAFDFLVAEAFAPEQTHQPSWTKMCAVHNLPADAPDASSYPDIGDMAAQFNRRHMSGFQAAASE